MKRRDSQNWFDTNAPSSARTRKLGWFGFLFGISLLACCITCARRKTRVLSEQDVATAWAQLTLYITKNTPANTPTFASRGFGYIGFTMYESVVHGYADYKSLAGQLTELSQLPLPSNGEEYNWILSMNAAEAEILRNIYIQTSRANKEKIDSLEAVIFDQYAHNINVKVVERSVDFGKSVAKSIFEWSKTDGGHRGYLENFDKDFKIVYKPGGWEPPLYGQTFSHQPLHPHWGQNRNFVKLNSEMPLPKMIKYDTSRQSEYYKQFLRVYEKSKTLTQQEKEIALWWNDDPNETFTPPGHSYHLALNLVRQENPPLIICAETFARTGIAVADAFINCWRWKYHYLSERPFSFITRNIDQHWESFWPDPPFPAFPSGHATQASAAVTVLSDLYGEKLDVYDSAHIARTPDELRSVGFKPRKFETLWQIATETADSRFYGGIHSPQDNDVGLKQGRNIGTHVNQLHWHVK